MAFLGRQGVMAPLTSADIPDNSITAAKIVTDTIAAGDLAPNSVGASELADDAVDTAAIADSVTLVTPNLGIPSAVTLTNATFPAGHVVQAVGNFSSTQRGTSGSEDTWVSYLDGQVSLTPQSSSNKIMLFAAFPMVCAASQTIYVTFRRSNATTGDDENIATNETDGLGSFNGTAYRIISWNYMDTNFTAGENNDYRYSVQPNTDDTFYIGHNTVAGGIIAMEIQA